MATASGRPQFNCQFCLRTFARQEHLTRHARAHTFEKPYSCARCDKSFSRQDVLQRHEATHAAGTISRKPVSSRACKECAAGRVRCSRELPCGRCQDKKLECSYPISRTRNARLKIHSTIAPMPYPISPKTRSPDDVGEAGGDDNQDGGNGTSSDRVETNTTTDNDEQALDYSMADWTSDEPASSAVSRINPAWQPCSESFAAAPPPFAAISQAEDTPSNQLIDNDSPEPVVGLSTNWLYDDWDHALWENQLGGIPHGLGSMTFALSSEAIAPEPLQSWLPNQRIPAGAHNPARLTIDLADGSSPSVVGSLPDSSTSRLAEGTFYVQNGVSRAPFRGQLLCSNSHSSTAVTEASLTESQGSTHGIPQSLDQSESVDWDDCFVSDIVYSNMVQAIHREATAHSFDTQTTSVPPLGHIRCFVRLYYRHFHPTYPFVRHSSSTWQDNNSWILLMAVSAAGAKYLGGPWSESMSQSLEVILKQRFDLNQDDDDDNTWIPGRFESSNPVDLVTLQAAILNLICRLHSGCKNRMSHALTQRLNLVEMCRRMKLLSRTSPPVVLGVEYDGDAIATWLQVQTEIRTASMIWGRVSQK
ncbi:hypothetical protein NW762_006155 [Fusarium torreyae]|uniref:Transcription factor n=1 Tax=Fusarium torreyae TaxID=1237075 RepID=A0A9W8RZW5_9HYPO|nr:hypothetical protein NW762_006155 [Fusarium torreyae]